MLIELGKVPAGRVGNQCGYALVLQVFADR